MNRPARIIEPKDLAGLTEQHFVALLPAMEPNDVASGVALALSLAAKGCLEICFAGAFADSLHDEADHELEQKEQMIVTVGLADIDEAIEFFLGAMGAGRLLRIAVLPADHVLRARVLSASGG